MRKKVSIYTIILVLAYLLVDFYVHQPLAKEDISALPIVDSQQTYLVTRVVDGDTISVDFNGVEEKVRLIGINTPETVDPRKSVECFGKEASAHLKSLIEGVQVKLVVDTTQLQRDKYSRLLRYVDLPDGTDINLKMIEGGYAYEYTYSNTYERQKIYKQAELVAREGEKGLWAEGTCGGVK